MLTLFPLALALSTDAFAGALGRGVREANRSLAAALRMGLVFGGTEGLMCYAGWSLGALFADQIKAVDHWIALILLSGIGLLMIRSSAPPEGSDDAPRPRRQTWLITGLTAIGTSIDSATVGVALALTGASPLAALIIGLTSFAAAATGFLAGPYLGRRMGQRAERLGGLLLIAIGLKIFIEHTWLAA